MILETERLVLRELRDSDAKALAETLSDPVNMRFYPQPYDRAGVEDWIARNQIRYLEHGHGLWAMILKGEDRLIGDCGLVEQNLGDTFETEISYHVSRAFQRNGYATEAASACRDFGFTQRRRERLIALIRPENLASRRVAERVGMQAERQILWRGIPHLIYAVERLWHRTPIAH